jgi:hypothetical protein
MKWQANPYALPPFAIAFILLGISVVAWRWKPGNGVGIEAAVYLPTDQQDG